MEPTYRERTGKLAPIPPGTELEVKYSPLCRFYVFWGSCPDEEGIVEWFFPSRNIAEIYIEKRGWKAAPKNKK